MSKSKQKTRTYYHEDVIIILHNKYGFTKDYIRKSIRGDRVGIIPDKLKSEYHEMNNASKKALHEVSQKQK